MKLILGLIMFASVQCYNQQAVLKLTMLAESNQAINLSGCDMRGLGNILQEIDFSEAQLSGALFSVVPSTTQNVVIGCINMAGQACNLSHLNFSNATCVSTSFVGANLTEANFTGADIAYADFSGANLTGANFTNAKNIALARFCNAIMPDGSVHGKGYFLMNNNEKCFAHCPSG